MAKFDQRWVIGRRLAVVEFPPNGGRPRLIAYGRLERVGREVWIVAEDGRRFDPERVQTLPPGFWFMIDGG